MPAAIEFNGYYSRGGDEILEGSGVIAFGGARKDCSKVGVVAPIVDTVLIINVAIVILGVVDVCPLGSLRAIYLWAVVE